MHLDLDLRDLELLEALQQHQSLTAAATHLHVSQPALSQRLLRLEQRLGAPLFERRGRRLVANAAGQRMLQATRVTLHELRDAVRDVARIVEPEPASIRLWTQCSTNYQWLPPVVHEFRRQHPEAEVAIVNLNERPLVAALESGELDVALVSKLDRQLDRVRLHELFDDELLAIVSPEHPWAGRPYVGADDFADVELVVFDSYDPTREPATPLPLPPGARPATLTLVPLVTDLLVESIVRTPRVTVLPSWTAAPYLAAGMVVGVQLGPKPQGRTWYAATRRGRQSQLVRDFLDQLRSSLAAGEHERPPARLPA